MKKRRSVPPSYIALLVMLFRSAHRSHASQKTMTKAWNGKKFHQEVWEAAEDVLHHELQLLLGDDLLRKQVQALEEVLVLLAVAHPAHQHNALTACTPPAHNVCLPWEYEPPF